MRLLAGAVGEKIDSAAIGRNIFIFPEGIAVNASGDAFVADADRILTVSSSGLVSHFSKLEGCYDFHGATFDGAGNFYTSCAGAVYKMDAQGAFTLLAGVQGKPADADAYADGKGAAARFSWLINDLLADAAGNVYVSDLGNSRVRKIAVDGTVSTLAGNGAFASTDGVGTSASIARPWRLALDLQGNLLVSDSCALRRITPAAVVTTIVGNSEQCDRVDGAGTAARLLETNGIAVDTSGNVFLADYQQIRKLAPDGKVTTLVGAEAQLARVQGMAIDRSGNLLVVDAGSPNRQLRKVSPQGVVSVHAGTESLLVLTAPKSPGYVDGSATTARFRGPRGIAADRNGNIYVPDADNGVVRALSPNGDVTTVADRQAMALSTPQAAVADQAGNVVVSGNDGKLRRIASGGGSTLVPLPTTPLYPGYGLDRPLAMAVDASGNLFVAFQLSKQIDPGCVSTGMTPCHRAYKVAINRRNADGSWTALADSDQFYRNADGSNSANLVQVNGMVVDGTGKLFLSDGANHTILSWSSSGAGVLVPAQAGLRYPTLMQIDGAGNIYLIDNSGLTVRKVTPAGAVSTIAGTAGKNDLVLGSSPWSLSEVSGLALDGKGNLVLSVAHGLVVLERI